MNAIMTYTNFMAAGLVEDMTYVVQHTLKRLMYPKNKFASDQVSLRHFILCLSQLHFRKEQSLLQYLSFLVELGVTHVTTYKTHCILAHVCSMQTVFFNRTSIFYSLCLQTLEKELSRLIREHDEQAIVKQEGRIVIPPHLINVRLGNRQHVMVGGGRSFSSWTMTEILAKAGLIPGLDSGNLQQLNHDKASLAHLQHTGLVWDIMYRYGEDITKHKGRQTAEMMKLLKIDQYKRSLAMMAEVRNIKHVVQGKALGEKEEVAETFTMSLTIKQGRDLPNMDVMHSIDAYCVVSIDNLQEEVYQTKVVVKDRNPVWNASFEWKVPVQSQLLTIAVVDHDTVTEDDLVSICT
jgi:hypothetical protein